MSKNNVKKQRQETTSKNNVKKQKSKKQRQKKTDGELKNAYCEMKGAAYASERPLFLDSFLKLKIRGL